MYAMSKVTTPHHQGNNTTAEKKKKKKDDKDREKHEKDKEKVDFVLFFGGWFYVWASFSLKSFVFWKPKKKNTTAYQVFCKEYRVNINAEQPGLGKRSSSPH